MKKLEDLTPEIIAKIPKYIEKYTRGIYDGERYKDFKFENAQSLVDWHYEFCWYKKPIMLVAENPYEARLLFNSITANYEEFEPIIGCLHNLMNNLPQGQRMPKSIHDTTPIYEKMMSAHEVKFDPLLRAPMLRNLDSEINNAIRLKLYEPIREALVNSILCPLNELTRDIFTDQKLQPPSSKLYRMIYNEAYSALTAQLFSKLGEDQYLEVMKKINSEIREKRFIPGVKFLDEKFYNTLTEHDFTGNVTTGISSNVTLALYSFLKNEFEIEEKWSEELDKWNDLYLKSGVYFTIFSELFCVVCKYPKQIHTNTLRQLNNINSTAIEWGALNEQSAFNCFFVNGKNLSKKEFEAFQLGLNYSK